MPIPHYFIIRSLCVYNEEDFENPNDFMIPKFKSRRVLEPAEYLLSRGQAIFPGFFGENINVQAIVGKNGSGKSTIMDLMLKLVNNLGYVLFYNRDCDYNSKLEYQVKYVRRVYVDLCYELNGVEGLVMCRDNNLSFRFGNKTYYWGKKMCTQGEVKEFSEASDAEVSEIASNFFYTLVLNYSIHALNEEIYQHDLTVGGTGNYAWIKALFNKNDGYRIPVALNPYRNNGKLDMARENDLNRSRLEALLIFYEEQGQQFLSDYSLADIILHPDFDHILGKFGADTLPFDVDKTLFDEDLEYRNAQIMSAFDAALCSPKSYTCEILRDLLSGKNTFDTQEKFVKLAYLYLVYKVLNVLGTYPSYSEYNDFHSLKLAFLTETGDVKGSIWEPSVILDVVSQIKRDNSHITLKIRQTVNFLEKVSVSKANLGLLDDFFDYKTYFAMTGSTISTMSLDEIMENLPPAFFRPDIEFRKSVQEVSGNRQINIRDLSSGELQYIHTLSSIVYHIKNIASVAGDGRVKYKQVNILMDEIEMCYHPQYQKEMVYKLIDTLTRLRLNEDCGFNIILATHSPFVLSDIPKASVLYLEEGKDVSNRIKFSPFAANVNDTLHQSFFMKDGFLGTFVSTKISTLCNYLEGSQVHNGWDDKKVECFIEEIGDPLIKQQLWTLYLKKRFAGDKFAELAWLKDRVRELEVKHAED